MLLVLLFETNSIAIFQMRRITCLIRLGQLADAHSTADKFQIQNSEFRISKCRDFSRSRGAWTSIPPILEDALRSVGVPE
jgi:hypothetical protein